MMPRLFFFFLKTIRAPLPVSPPWLRTTGLGQSKTFILFLLGGLQIVILMHNSVALLNFRSATDDQISSFKILW